MSLRRRLFVPVLAVLIPIVGIEAYNQYELHLERESDVSDAALLQARRISAEQQRIIEGVHEVLATLAVLSPIREQETARCNELFGSVLPRYKGFEELVATRADGEPFCRADVNGTMGNDRASIANLPIFRATMKSGEFTVGGYAFDRRHDRSVFHLATPILDASGRPNGIVYVSYSLDWLASRLKGDKWEKDQAFSVIGPDGVVMVRQPNGDHYVGKKAPSDVWNWATQAHEPVVFETETRPGGIKRIFGMIPLKDSPNGLAVAVGLDRELAFAPLSAATIRDALVILLGAIGAFLLAWWIGLRLVRAPIEDLLRTTQRWRQGDFTARSNLSGSSELDQLGAAFDAMAEELDRALQRKDVLLRELRHRVMNNLQIISALFNLQAKSLRDPEARTQFIETAGRINSMALAYRRMHSAGGAEVVEFAEYLRELCTAIADSLMQGGGTCNVEADSILLGPQAASSLALIVNELVTNAVKHGEKNTAIAVKLERTGKGGRLSVRNFGNVGAGFDPTRSAGFGMQMVLILVKQLGGELKVSWENGQTEFAVTFAASVIEPRQTVVIDEKRNTAKAPV